MDITCIGPDGTPITFPAGGVGNSGGSLPQYSNMKARRINLSIMDVQETIQEGRAAGIKPFSIEGPGTGVGQGGQF